MSELTSGLTSGTVAPSPDAPDEPAPASFEQAIGELEDLVHGMEGGGFSLEQSLSAYKRGATLVAFCRRSLADARQQVRILEGDLLKTFELDQAGAPGEAD